MEQRRRKYPVGIQTFSEIIEEGYVYADKTALVYKLVDNNKYVFLSRPRRFGKSLLSSTLHSYFAGEKDLFKGLAIESMETEWRKYPVLHFDLSTTKNRPIEGIQDELLFKLQKFEEIYGSQPQEKTPGQKLSGLIQRAYRQTGLKTVVLIDEYDAPLLDVLHITNKLDNVRIMMQEFFAPLKSEDASLKFVFITGITKFSQLSIFSVINNLTNITMQPDYSAICGITEKELRTYFSPDIEMLTKHYACTSQEMKQMLKVQYDGYHFSRISDDIYNPFSLMKAFSQKELAAYWFESATPTYLIRQMEHFNTDITGIDDILAAASDFDRPTEAMTNAIPLLYQSGYLTIKSYEPDTQMYHLSLPNKEVRTGLIESLIPIYLNKDTHEVRGFIYNFCDAVKKDNLEVALISLQSYMASIPYPEGGKEILEDMSKSEYYYETIFYLMFSFMNNYVQTQVKTCRGRADMVMTTPRTIYVFELKINKSAQEALNQINDKGYALPYKSDERQIVKCGISFSTKTRSIEEWICCPNNK